MGLGKKTIDDENYAGKRVLVRCDFNVPMKDGVITNDNRINAALPTIKKLIADGAKVILCSHLGKPKNGPEAKFSLAPVAVRLSEKLGQPVTFADDDNVVGENAKAAVATMGNGEVVLLQNTRFRKEETKNEPAFSEELASLADAYVDDAFGSCHRAHCSTAGVTDYVKDTAVGYLMEKEIKYLGNAVNDPERPFTAILGGAKVADKLNQLFKTDRPAFEGFWDDINIFIKYGCMKEEKLYDKVKDILLLKTTDGVYETVAEYLEKNKEKHENVIYFATDTNQQAQYIRLFKEQGLEAAIMDTPVDKPFVSFLEYKNQDIKLKVQRVDADIDSLQEKEDAEISEAKKQADEFEANQMQELFRAAVANEKLNVKLEALKAEKVSAMILLSEESRRMMEMMEAYANNEEFKAMFANMKPDETLVLNKNNKLVKALLSMAGKEEKKEDATLLCHQLYDLALMSHRPLTSEEMTAFIDRSNLLLEKLTAFEA